MPSYAGHELAEDQQATLINVLPQMAGEKLQIQENLFIH